MFAIPTTRRQKKRGNLSIRWRPDRHWLLSIVVALVLVSAVSVVLILSLWYAQ